MVIIADMILSALSWEQEHGLPPHVNHKIEPQEPLTIIGVTDTLKTSQNADEGENHDHKD